MNDDLISRQAAIDKLKREEKIFYSPTGLRYLIGAIRELPSAQPEQKWIPCSDRPPEESGDYLVTVARHSGELWVEVDQFDNENGSWWHYMDGVTAWTPRPEPYKGE